MHIPASDLPTPNVAESTPYPEFIPIELVLATIHNPAVRKTSRINKTPSYMRYYHCNLFQNKSQPASNILYPLNNYVSYTSLSSSHGAYLLHISSNFEPQFYQAVNYPQWREAMANELEVMESNHTWSVQPLPKGKHSMGVQVGL